MALARPANTGLLTMQYAIVGRYPTCRYHPP